MACLVQFQSNLANPNVKWEQTKNTNIGLDGTFFNWKLNFSVDVYDRHTDGLLLKVPLPRYSAQQRIIHQVHEAPCKCGIYEQ
jgi:hypothetical protein